MLKGDVVAMLDMMYGNDYVLKVKPIFLERYKYCKQASSTKRGGRYMMWGASIHCEDVFSDGAFWHPTNHQAVKEIYEIVLRARSSYANS